MNLGTERTSPPLPSSSCRRSPRDVYPYIAEHMEQHTLPRERGEDFAFGLDLILDGLERFAAPQQGPGHGGGAPTERPV